jgi:hypothetical protein
MGLLDVGRVTYGAWRRDYDPATVHRELSTMVLGRCIFRPVPTACPKWHDPSCGGWLRHEWAGQRVYQSPDQPFVQH